MKKHLILTVTFLIVSTALIAQYDCSKFYPFSEGATSQLTLYNAKGKTEGTMEYKVVAINVENGKTVATINTKLADDKGTEISATEYTATCKDGTVSIDFNSLMRPGMMDQFGDMDVDAKVTGTDLDLPNDLSVGQTLPDAEMNIAMSFSGMNMNMSTFITDRKVVGKETITTPAGTFECYVIEQSMNMKSMASNQKMRSKSWIAEGVGVVKTEDYKKNGKLRGMSLLTSFTR